MLYSHCNKCTQSSLFLFIITLQYMDNLHWVLFTIIWPVLLDVSFVLDVIFSLFLLECTDRALWKKNNFAGKLWLHGNHVSPSYSHPVLSGKEMYISLGKISPFHSNLQEMTKVTHLYNFLFIYFQDWTYWMPYCSALFIFLFIFFFGIGPGIVCTVYLNYNYIMGAAAW